MQNIDPDRLRHENTFPHWVRLTTGVCMHGNTRMCIYVAIVVLNKG